MKAKSISLFSCRFAAWCLLLLGLLVVLTPDSEGAVPQLVNYRDCPCANRDSPVVDEIRMPAPQKYMDYDGDGALDLVRKEVNGKVYVYINKGTNEDRVYREGIPYEGKEIEFETQAEALMPTPKAKTSWVYLEYERFDVYIDSAYYDHNTPAIDEFFDEFEERYNLLETWTDWSAEEYDEGDKLYIDVIGTTGCYGGLAASGYAQFRFSDPLHKSGCEMAYWENGTPYFSNPGELGDWWPYMGVGIHETTHAISPQPILSRLWLAEGWAVYDEYNILSRYYGNEYPDINQETSDTYIYSGTGYYNWDGVAYGGFGYITNDYHDTSTEQNAIQESKGN